MLMPTTTLPTPPQAPKPIRHDVVRLGNPPVRLEREPATGVVMEGPREQPIVLSLAVKLDQREAVTEPHSGDHLIPAVAAVEGGCSAPPEMPAAPSSDALPVAVALDEVAAEAASTSVEEVVDVGFLMPTPPSDFDSLLLWWTLRFALQFVLLCVVGAVLPRRVPQIFGWLLVQPVLPGPCWLSARRVVRRMTWSGIVIKILAMLLLFVSVMLYVVVEAHFIRLGGLFVYMIWSCLTLAGMCTIAAPVYTVCACADVCVLYLLIRFCVFVASPVLLLLL